MVVRAWNVGGTTAGRSGEFKVVKPLVVFPRAEGGIRKKGVNWPIFQAYFLVHLRYWMNSEGVCVKMGGIEDMGKKKPSKMGQKPGLFCGFWAKVGTF